MDSAPKQKRRKVSRKEEAAEAAEPAAAAAAASSAGPAITLVLSKRASFDPAFLLCAPGRGADWHGAGGCANSVIAVGTPVSLFEGPQGQRYVQTELPAESEMRYCAEEPPGAEPRYLIAVRARGQTDLQVLPATALFTLRGHSRRDFMEREADEDGGRAAAPHPPSQTEGDAQHETAGGKEAGAADAPAAAQPATLPSYIVERQKLVGAFGTRVSRAVVAASESAKVNVSDLGEAGEFTDALQAAADSTEGVGTAQDRDDVLPPHDLQAKTPEEAYPLEKMFTEDEWESLKGPCKSFLSAEAVAQNAQFYPAYVNEHAQRLLEQALTMDKRERAKQARVLCYLAYLVGFDGLDVRHALQDRVEVTRVLQAPDAVVAKLYEMYTQACETPGFDTPKYLKPKSCQDRLRFRVLGICLHIDGFRVDPAQMAALLRIGVNTAWVYLREMGCKRVTEDGIALAVLKAPLDLPGPKHRGKPKRR